MARHTVLVLLRGGLLALVGSSVLGEVVKSRSARVERVHAAVLSLLGLGALVLSALVLSALSLSALGLAGMSLLGSRGLATIHATRVVKNAAVGGTEVSLILSRGRS